MNFAALKSENIYLNDETDPIAGYILIQNGLIFDILEQFPSEEIDQKLKTNYTLYDFSNQYIFPGLIDLNTHLNSTFSPDWEDVANITKMAAQGGITTIVDNPIMNLYNENFDEKTAVRERASAIDSKIYVDCGLLANISAENYKELKEIYIETGVLGFKGYLCPSFLNKLPTLDKESVKKIPKAVDSIEEFSEKNRIFIALHPEFCNQRDMHLPSPLRTSALDKRRDLNVDIKGGHSENVEDLQDSDKEKDKNEEDNEKMDTVDEIMFLKSLKEREKGDLSPTSANLKVKAKFLAKQDEERQIARLDMQEYQNAEKDDILANDINEDSELSLEEVEATDTESSQEEEASESPLLNDTNEIQVIKREKTKGFQFNPFIGGMKKALENLSNSPKKVVNITTNTADTNENDNEIPVKKNLTQLKMELAEKKNKSSLFERRKMITVGSVIPQNKMNLGGKLSLKMGGKNFEVDNEKKEARKNREYENYLSNHPLVWENNAVFFILKSFKDVKNANILIECISAASLAFQVRSLKKKQPETRIFCDTSLLKFGKTKFKTSPPIREKHNRNLLVQTLRIKDAFQTVSSHHLQTPNNYKIIDEGNFRRAFNGVSIIGFNLQILWSKLLIFEKRRKLNELTSKLDKKKIEKICKMVIKLLCKNPAELLNLERKGTLEKNKFADIVVWNPFEIKKITKDDIFLKYQRLYVMKNQRVYGNVTHTFLRGNLIFSTDKSGKKCFSKSGQIIYNSYKK